MKRRSPLKRLVEFLKEAGNQVIDTTVQKVQQGSSETASALYTGSAFVQYSSGQLSPEEAIREREAMRKAQEDPQPEQSAVQERGGREM